MARKIHPALLFALLAASALAQACGSSTSTNVTAPSTDSRCQATVEGAPTSFGPSGGEGNLTVNVARECTWSAGSTAPWIELTGPREGQGEARIPYRVAPNNVPLSRQGGITVADERVNVSQQAAPCSFDVSRTNDAFGAGGGQAAIHVATHDACGWTAATEAPWITLSPTSGTGTGSVQVTAAANSGTASRTATLVVAGESLGFTQAGRASDPPPPPAPPPPAPPPPPPPTPQCSYAVAPDAREFPAAGGTGSFSLTTAEGCAWTASTSAPWIAITSPPSGSGTAQITYAALPNPSASSREATIVVGSAQHRVQQNGSSGDDDDDDDDDDREVRIRGRVSSLSGSCPAVQFVVNGTTVITSSRTDFRRGNCSQLVTGLEVEVDGTRQPDGRVLARRVTLHRDDDD